MAWHRMAWHTYKRPPPVLMLKELERPKPAMLCYPASRVFAAAVAPVLSCLVLHRLYSIFALLSRQADTCIRKMCKLQLEARLSIWSASGWVMVVVVEQCAVQCSAVQCSAPCLLISRRAMVFMDSCRCKLRARTPILHSTNSTRPLSRSSPPNLCTLP
jgi:hypothetical protein